MRSRIALLVGAALAAAGLAAIPALAHQTVRSDGATVTLHVDPNDEPEAGSSASIRVTRVRVPRRASFRFSTCGCRLKITDSSGSVLMNHAMRQTMRFTFPRPGAYRLTYSGRYRRSGRRRSFSANFSIRAV